MQLLRQQLGGFCELLLVQVKAHMGLLARLL
jgi:hypothetical protein